MTDDVTPPEPTHPPAGDEPLGEAGTKALKAERDRASAAERELRAMQAQFSDATSRLTAADTQIADFNAKLAAAEAARLRYEVAYDKGIPKELIDRLRGDDIESLSADADSLKGLLAPITPTSTTPRPDPSQGPRSPAATGPKAAFEQWAREALNH